MGVENGDLAGVGYHPAGGRCPEGMGKGLTMARKRAEKISSVRKEGNFGMVKMDDIVAGGCSVATRPACCGDAVSPRGATGGSDMENEPEKNELMKRFEMRIEGKTAVLDYVERGDSTLAFNHTFVPPELRGRNVAAILTRYALEDARRQGKKVVPQCSYVATFMERNKEYADLRAESPV